MEEVLSKWWDVGDWPLKQVGDRRLALETGGRWEIGPRNNGR